MPTRYTIKINPNFVEDYRALGDRRMANTTLEKTPFPIQKDVFMTAVALGYNKNKQKDLPSNTHELFNNSVFSDQDVAVLRALFLEKNKLEITKDLEDLKSVFQQAERWAEAGFRYLKAKTIRESSDDNIYCLVDMINEQK